MGLLRLRLHGEIGAEVARGGNGVFGGIEAAEWIKMEMAGVSEAGW